MKTHRDENKSVSAGKLSIAVIFVALCVVFTACGGDDTEKTSDSSAATTVSVIDTGDESGAAELTGESGSAAVSRDEKDTSENVVQGDTEHGEEDSGNAEDTKNTGSGSTSAPGKDGSTSSGVTSGTSASTSAGTSASTSANTPAVTTTAAISGGTTPKVTTPADMPDPPSIFETLPNGGIELPDDVWEY